MAVCRLCSASGEYWWCMGAEVDVNILFLSITFHSRSLPEGYDFTEMARQGIPQKGNAVRATRFPSCNWMYNS